MGNAEGNVFYCVWVFVKENNVFLSLFICSELKRRASAKNVTYWFSVIDAG